MLGGLTIYPRVGNFLQCTPAKNYENWLAVDKVIAKNIRLTFFGPPCIYWLLSRSRPKFRFSYVTKAKPLASTECHNGTFGSSLAQNLQKKTTLKNHEWIH